MIIRYSSMPYTFDLLSRDLLLQRLAVRLNHNIVCHTSRGAGGLLGKRSMHRRCGWVNNSANRCRTSPPCGLGKMRTNATPFVVGQIRRVSPALHGAERRPPSRQRALSRQSQKGCSRKLLYCLVYRYALGPRLSTASRLYRVGPLIQLATRSYMPHDWMVMQHENKLTTRRSSRVPWFRPSVEWCR